jgi:hypothetical protein
VGRASNMHAYNILVHKPEEGEISLEGPTRRGLDWMIGFIASYTFTHFAIIGNTALSLFYTLYSSPLHTH